MFIVGILYHNGERNGLGPELTHVEAKLTNRPKKKQVWYLHFATAVTTATGRMDRRHG